MRPRRIRAWQKTVISAVPLPLTFAVDRDVAALADNTPVLMMSLWIASPPVPVASSVPSW